ncbi:cytochrome c biogenesis protein ResB [Nocardioides insulae]|uniref:cytochrome c biogenesis protein ResB n=1 Tax=Nocardioides insulae TaxID=394734 RepID=UPI0004235F31|nr:cytochrome c biogenesis protein ResB [Nocardioides insulae]
MTSPETDTGPETTPGTGRETEPAGSADSGGKQRKPRRAGELNAVEFARWGWRQLTSMRTALVLLLLLALAAVPGSIVPQEGVDSLKTSNWQDAHPKLTPIYERLGLFDVYSSPWFAAIYLLLMVSLIGCILPRTKVYWKALRAQPPAAPRHLDRLPASTSYTTDESPEEVLARARTLLKGKRYRLRRTGAGAGAGVDGADAVSAERGYLREAGNLLFHVSIIVVLVGFAMGSLFGYKGGVIVVAGQGFSNIGQQYDEFQPGSLFDEDSMEPFSFTIDDFDVNWIMDGPRAGMAQKFVSHISYTEEPGAEEKTYDLQVNHPLQIGDTELFLIGHGYAPVLTVRDGEGNITYSGPTIFLPEDESFMSFGVVKAPYAEPEGIGMRGLFFPWYMMTDEGDPTTLMGDDRNPLVSLNVWKGDLNLESGPQSVYVLDTSKADQLMGEDDVPYRMDLQVGDTKQLPDGLGSVTFEGVQPWNKLQISQTPGKELALGGVILALIGLLGSLFIRPRRVWVRARRTEEGTLVEVASLDRSGGGDPDVLVARLVTELAPEGTGAAEPRGSTEPAEPAQPENPDNPENPEKKS